MYIAVWFAFRQAPSNREIVSCRACVCAKALPGGDALKIWSLPIALFPFVAWLFRSSLRNGVRPNDLKWFRMISNDFKRIWDDCNESQTTSHLLKSFQTISNSFKSFEVISSDCIRFQMIIFAEVLKYWHRLEWLQTSPCFHIIPKDFKQFRIFSN